MNETTTLSSLPLTPGEAKELHAAGSVTIFRRIEEQPTATGNGYWEFRGEFIGADQSLRSHLFHDVYGVEGTPWGSVYSDGTGDRVWIQERWVSNPYYPSDGQPEFFIYSDDPTNYDSDGDWMPAQFMPYGACRCHAEIADVDVAWRDDFGLWGWQITIERREKE